MIQVFQEELPFTNKRTTSQITSGGTYLNPIIIPMSLDLTDNPNGNIFETVIYLHNNDLSKYYRNVVVSLVKDDTNNTDMFERTFNYQNGIYESNFLGTSVRAALSEEDLQAKTFTVDYSRGTNPITDSSDQDIKVKFSFGYTPISLTEWDKTESMLVIPNIGTSGLGNISYIPIRMRIEFKTRNTPIVTTRKYHLDVSWPKWNTDYSEGIPVTV